VSAYPEEMIDDGTRGSKASPAVPSRSGVRDRRKRGFLVGMVNRLQHGTARRVPHYPEALTRWHVPEVLTWSGWRVLPRRVRAEGCAKRIFPL